MKTPMAKAPKMSAPKTMGGGGGKPHIRMRKLKPVAPSAFPASPMAFPPPDAGAATDPTQAMNAPPGGMAPTTAPGDMGT